MVGINLKFFFLVLCTISYFCYCDGAATTGGISANAAPTPRGNINNGTQAPTGLLGSTAGAAGKFVGDVGKAVSGAIGGIAGAVGNTASGAVGKAVGVGKAASRSISRLVADPGRL